MPPRQAESPDEFDFNDMSGDHNEGQDGAPQRHNSGSNEGGNDAASKQKRIACVLCRKRKLRCDGQRPTCGTCKRLSHDCAYDEVRRKSGPKRGYVKALEARLRTSQSCVMLRRSRWIRELTLGQQNKWRPSSRHRTAPNQHHRTTISTR